MVNIYVIGSAYNYCNFINNYNIVPKMEDADIVLFTGGEDVSPFLYEEQNICSYTNKDRDFFEIIKFKEAVKLNKFLLGICRGSQFLTVMAGGKLIQDVTGHGIGGTHPIINMDIEYSREIDITSTHHQMMYPFSLPENEYKLLAYSKEQLSKSYISDSIKDLHKMKYESEIVYYPKIKALAIQGHPEYMDKKSKAVHYCNWLINKYLLK